MTIPRRFVDELVSRCDITDVVSSYVTLNKKGSNYWGLCPFHNEKTPSFSVSPERQIYKCFGCGKGGGVISFVMEMENLTRDDAVHLLAQREGVEVPEDENDRGWANRRRRLLDANRDAARFYHEYLQSPGGEKVRAYLEKRRISAATATRFGLGAAPDAWDGLLTALIAKGYSKEELIAAGLVVPNKSGGVYDKFRARLMLPVIDMRGEVVGFTSRILPGGEGAKYLNTSETPVFHKSRELYALNLAHKTKRTNLILVEGNLDVITLHQAGFDNTVATMGTSLTQEHARILARYTKEVILCYDNDGAGKNATDRALGIFKDVDVNVRVLQLPNVTDREGSVVLDENGKPLKQDPDDFIKNYGAAVFEKYLTGSAGKNDYRLDTLKAAYDLQKEEGRLEFLKKAVDTAAAMSNAVEREIFCRKAADAGGITAEAMLQETERTRMIYRRREKKKEERMSMTPRQSLQPKDRALRYENIRSARAEEGLLRLVLLDPALLDLPGLPGEEEFSSPLLGRVYAALSRRHAEGKELGLPYLTDELTGEEMSHLVGVAEQPESAARSREAFADYLAVMRAESARRTVSGEDAALLAFREQKRKKQLRNEDKPG